MILVPLILYLFVYSRDVHSSASPAPDVNKDINIPKNIEFVPIPNEIRVIKRNNADNMSIKSCADNKLSRTDRIIGGRPANILNYPYMAQLLIPSTPGRISRCGGSIINNRFILTALHCMKTVTDDKVKSIQIYVGSGTFARGTKYLVEKIFLPSTVEIYNKVARRFEEIPLNTNLKKVTNTTIYMNDIAIVKLTKPIVYSSAIAKITFCRDFIEEGRSVQISGWGLLPEETNSLYHTTVTTISNRNCAVALNRIRFDGTFKLCTHQERTGACYGDSGGPLTLNNMQIGIVANSYDGCLQKYPDIFSRTSDYLQWIQYIAENR